jgi:hypothetical protein
MEKGNKKEQFFSTKIVLWLGFVLLTRFDFFCLSGLDLYTNVKLYNRVSELNKEGAF